MSRIRPVACALCCIISLGALAQPTTHPARSGEGSQTFPRIRVILQDLKLSDDQKKKIEDVFTSAGENMRAMGAEMREMSQQQRLEKYRQMITDLREDIGKELNSDQKAKFNEAMEKVGRPNALSAPGSTTQPAGGQGITQMMMRMRSRLEQLGLSDEQKENAKKVFQDTTEKLKQLSTSTERGGQEMRQKAREILESSRDSLKEILTPEQWEKFTSGLRESFGAGAGEKPATQPKMIDEKMKDERMSDEKPSKDDDKAKEKSSSKDDQSSEAPADAPQAGQAAPAFALQKVDGSTLELSAFKGKVVVLAFGSYSSPTFRRRAAALEEIRRKNDNRANFLFVYTKESHPKGGWEVDRNKQEDVEVTQASDLSDRSKQAKRMHEALRFNWPLLVDSMDDSAAKAYGAGECTTVIINRDGTIYSRLQWSDPYTLKRQLDDLLSKPAPSKTTPDAGV
jgi:peroxiredoxin